MTDGDDAEIEKARREQPGENDGDQAVGGADRKVEVLVDDDEGHSDRDDADPRGVAQQRVKRLRRAEEGRIDEGAAEIEQHKQGEQPRLPAADELGRRAAERCGRR